MADRLRKYYLEPSNPDVLAFHEGFADIVAILQHFSFSGILAETIARTRTNLQSATPLVELAQQFGYATGKGRALRSAVEATEKPDPTLYQTADEPHERGATLVAAVFDAFFSTYQARIQDLLRMATGGTGQLAAGELHPDLVGRVAGEAARTAQNVLTMCIRAFEYLPPVDVTFGDYLRALVTADYELVPNDPLEQRNALIESFRARGIIPTGVGSLALDALLWRERAISAALPPADVESVLRQGVQARRASDRDSDWDVAGMKRFAEAHASELDLDPDRPVAVRGFHASYRVTREGQLRVEMVLQFLQAAGPDEHPGLAGLPLRGGTTVVVDANGRIRYVISKPLPQRKPRDEADAVHQCGLLRLEQQRAHVEATDDADPRVAFGGDKYFDRRMARRAGVAALHRGLL